MKTKINFDFKIHDKVKLIDIEVDGHVDSLMQDINGQMYRVVYWHNGIRNKIWMYRREIK